MKINNKMKFFKICNYNFKKKMNRFKIALMQNIINFKLKRLNYKIAYKNYKLTLKKLLKKIANYRLRLDLKRFI